MVKINKNRLIEIIREELSDSFPPESESELEHTQMQQTIDDLKQALAKLKTIRQGKERIADFSGYSAEDGSNFPAIDQSIIKIEQEIEKMEANLQAERHSYSQYK